MDSFSSYENRYINKKQCHVHNLSEHRFLQLVKNLHGLKLLWTQAIKNYRADTACQYGD
jgi:hypothetical protein